ncbi:ubiquinone-dependent pyruvate dehydrogenase [Methylomonas methanica]|uniref:Pyruvate dehydrogenase (Cytochrome) n=1 Tax=Methylomonas methanica (strain DSM 25384 / MC09) TaxID=857087 RepID=G0A3E4_METMM|nr:ubiquinone-dependent pyruvate dehydrogenase [Methylomonas methanica]AEG00243.1 Pyruvate dehydrogenase (cytochrome) [Methylomonas methanica MC09]
MSKKVADIIVETLVEAGAKRCYGIVGDTINHFTDSINKSELKWVHVRHEEVGSLAAGGEAYMTGELALCAGTCGPGSLHFVNGIFESHRNGAPVVLIASNIDRVQQGLNFPQEVDQKKVYEQCSVFCEYISHPDQARRITALAAQAALANQAVAVIIVNGDMFQENSKDELHWSVNRSTPIVRPNELELTKLATLINEAEKITLYAGIGARNAHDQLIKLAKQLSAPIVHTSRSKEFIEPDNSYNVGMTGILGNKAGLHSVMQCDLLLCLGTDFAYTQFYPLKAKIVQIDINPENLGKRCPVQLGLIGDVAATLDALLPYVNPKPVSSHLLEAQEQWQDDLKTYRHRAESGEDLIHPQTVTHLLDELADDDAIFTADGGSPMVWLLRHLTAKANRRFLTSLLHGTMANAFPQALGIANAYPDRQVIAMCGDGGMTMLMGDLLTLVQENIPVKLLIYHNNSLGFVEMEQRVEGLLDSFTGLKNPNFAELGRTCGLEGWHVTKMSELESSMRNWLACEGPAILDVMVNRVELVMPPEIEIGQVASTALFGVKAVLHGRSEEVYTLLKDNFLR